MKKFLHWLKHELLEVLPPTIFFFIAFHMIAFTRALMLKHSGISVATGISVTVAALVVGKVVLISDHLPFINRFPEKPLMYNVMWKMVIYFLVALVVRYIEHVIPFVRESGSIATGNRRLLGEVVWPQFWAVQIWLLILFFFYCALRELIRVLGKERAMQIFFGKPVLQPR